MYLFPSKYHHAPWFGVYFVSLVLMGCGILSTLELYDGPSKPTAEIARLRGSHWDWKVLPQEIDGKTIHGSFGTPAWIELLPGTHTVKGRCVSTYYSSPRFVDGRGSMAWTETTSSKVTWAPPYEFQAGKKYGLFIVGGGCQLEIRELVE